jgi:hypothetical protein
MSIHLKITIEELAGELLGLRLLYGSPDALRSTYKAVSLLRRSGETFERRAFLGDIESERITGCAGICVLHVMDFTGCGLERL